MKHSNLLRHGCLLTFALAGFCSPAFAGQASDAFAIFVPPNNSNNGRDSALTITAHADGTFVDVVDTDEDGDSDDSVSATLARGQSIVIKVKDGAINDGAGGKWDGDTFLVTSNKPVSAMLSTKSEWQHDWVPAENQTMRGQEFFVWSPRPNWDIDAVAYEDDTRVEIFEVSTAAQEGSGITSVSLPGNLLIRQTINKGEDLLVSRGRAGTNLTRAGHTYRIVATKPVTVMYGSTYSRERDGGGFVPSETGTTVGTHFYFPVPSGRWNKHEREIRIVAGDIPSVVTLRGFREGDGWIDIDTRTLSAYGHTDFTGRSTTDLQRYDLFEVDATAPVNVFEANWLETGNSGTSDVISYASSLDNQGASDVGQEFVAYIGPPGIQSNIPSLGGRFSHLYITSVFDDVEVTVVDIDAGGAVVSEVVSTGAAKTITDVQITSEQFNALNRPSEGRRPYLRISATQPVSVAMANWNDNWLAFPSGITPKSIEVSVTAQEEAECERTLSYVVAVENQTSDSLSNVNFDVAPVGGVTLLVLPEVVPTLAPGERVESIATATIACADSVSGELIGVSVLVTGENIDNDEVVLQSTSTSPSVHNGKVGIIGVTAKADACSIELEWITEQDEGDADFQILRRLFGDTGAFDEVDRVPSLAPAQSGFVYGWRDTNAEQGVAYQYLVQAVEIGTTDEFAVGGPTVAEAGIPFTETPVSTGNLVSDFEGRGVVFADAAGDISSAWGAASGYDVDAVGIAYDPYNDSLYLSASAVGVFGDGDDDGDPDTNEIGEENGAIDRPRFSEDEGFAFVLDFDQDGEADAVVGVPFGADLDFLQASQANPDFADTVPTLAFTNLTVEQEGVLSVELLNLPSQARPDLELVVRNVSSLNGRADISQLGAKLFIAGPSITEQVEWAPSESYVDASEAMVVAGCGQRAEQIHLGVLGTFGNIFTGTPRFDFAPFGWEDAVSGEVLAAPPSPVPGQVITSPTVFRADQRVELNGLLADDALALSEQSLTLRDEGFIAGGEFHHVTEVDWAFAASEGDERYENIDFQTFRLFKLDCSARVIIEQRGTTGTLRDDRFVRMADDSVENLGSINPALTLAHSGIGTFETGGAMQRLNFSTPDDWIDDFGPPTAPEFTHYAFLDDTTYVHDPDDPDELSIFPLGKEGIEVQAGIWFINHYLWTYANTGQSQILTRFIPGEDCGGSL